MNIWNPLHSQSPLQRGATRKHKRNTSKCSFGRNFLVEHHPHNKIRKTKNTARSRISHCHLEETAREIAEVSIYATPVTEKTPETVSCCLFGAELWLMASSIRKRFIVKHNEEKHCLNPWEEPEETPYIYTMILSWDSTWLCEVSRALWRDIKSRELFYCWFGLYIIQYNRQSVAKLYLKNPII